MSRIIVSVLVAVSLLGECVAATYFAQVSSDNKVLRVVVVPDSAQPTGEAFCNELLGGVWKETFTNGGARGMYTGIGLRYSPAIDKFIHPATSVVAMLGDSIIAQMVGVKASQVVPFNSATLLGVSGQPTSGIVTQVSSIPAGTTHVFIEGGINDYIFGDSSQIIANYTSMLNAINANIVVVIIGILPVDEAALSAQYRALVDNAKITATNSGLAMLCASRSNCVMSAARHMNMSGKTLDGIHLPAATYPIFISAIFPSL